MCIVNRVYLVLNLFSFILSCECNKVVSEFLLFSRIKIKKTAGYTILCSFFFPQDFFSYFLLYFRCLISFKKVELLQVRSQDLESFVSFNLFSIINLLKQ